MIQTHKLVVIPVDGIVVTDQEGLSELDLSQCGIPDNIHALQWNNPIWPDKQNSHLNGLQYGQGSGWLEFRSNDPNENITELPQWAINCYDVWLQAYNIKQSELAASDAADEAAAAAENN
jgi:hypothetical protein